MLSDIELSENDQHSLQDKQWRITIITESGWPLLKLKYDVHLPVQMENTLNQQSIQAEVYGSIRRQIGKLVLQYWLRGVSLQFNQGEKIFFTGQYPTNHFIPSIQFSEQQKCKGNYERYWNRQGMANQQFKVQIDLENSLVPFVCFKILKRQKKDLDEFDDDEVIELIQNYENRQLKLRLVPNPKIAPMRQLTKASLTEQELKEQQEIIKDREFIVDCQLVRIMKTRKQVSHKELLSECIKLITNFKPDLNFIRKRIESLIEKEYIKREENDWYGQILQQILQEHIRISELI